MRLQLHLSPNTQPVPFTYLHNLTGALHKWLGRNSLHDGASLYSFGRLNGAEKIGNNLYYGQGATLTVSFYDSSNAWALARGIIQDDSLAFGMGVERALEMPAPQFNSRVRFGIDGEVIVRKKRPDGSRQYLLWTDEEANEQMTQLMQKKLQMAGFDEAHQQIRIRFDQTYTRARTKLMSIKGINHRGSVCPVVIEGTPEAIEFAWLVGVGELTGSGFGALI